MSRASNRKRAARADSHDDVLRELAGLPTHAGARLLAAEAADMPATKALCDSAAAAVAAALPANFEHEGRVYYLRTATVARLEVFADPGTSKKLAEFLAFDLAGHGHAPGH